jgi:hypothetical protein
MKCAVLLVRENFLRFQGDQEHFVEKTSDG